MKKVLIVSGDKGTADEIAAMLKELFPECAAEAAASGAEARQVIGGGGFDAVIIDCPLADESGYGLSEAVTDLSSAGCVVIADEEEAAQAGELLEGIGVMVISKPLDSRFFRQAMRFFSASRNRFLGLQRENLKLHRQLQEIKNVSRAKRALMKYLGFTEQQAHRYIEKQAMDLRITKNDVALKIIKMYEAQM